MKWGDFYGPHFVNRLRRGVKRHLSRPHRFICFTDDTRGLDQEVEALPLPEIELAEGMDDTRWQKMALFKKDLAGLSGTALYLDLDQVIVGDLEPFFTFPGKFRILRDAELFRAKPLRWVNPARRALLNSVGNSSVFRYEIGAHSHILDAYLADPDGAVRDYGISQRFQSAQLARSDDLHYWPKGWCVSFKNQCVPRHLLSFFKDPALPEGARIVCFAGQPKMEDVFSGNGGRWYRRIGDVEWLRRAWQMPENDSHD
ncbi:hypothetical protein E2A64_07540 [Pseudohoeflea suaedae]|uniref:Glycosyl transferase n=2 Tax=Pseudohoeflea suaedae TaxID=877384 RepID=A0A4R5PQZ8_9HYPH|nr:hypothetical protein E2A64_07540 [Pseudohoeflea suaedae]